MKVMELGRLSSMVLAPDTDIGAGSIGDSSFGGPLPAEQSGMGDDPAAGDAPPEDDGSGIRETPDEEPMAAETVTEDDPSADPNAQPPEQKVQGAPPAPAAPVDPVVQVAKSVEALAARMEARDQAQAQRVDSWRAEQAAARQQQTTQAAAQQKVQELENRIANARPVPPTDHTPENVFKYTEQMGQWAAAAAEARLEQRLATANAPLQEELASIKRQAQEWQQSQLAQQTESMIDQDMATLRSMPEMAWMKGPAENAFLNFWAAQAAAGEAVGKVVRGVDAARQFLSLVAAVNPSLRKQAQSPRPVNRPAGAPPRPAAPPQRGGVPPRGSARTGSPRAPDWADNIKF